MDGRNYLPLVAAGVDLTGLDISTAAIAQPPALPAAATRTSAGTSIAWRILRRSSRRR